MHRRVDPFPGAALPDLPGDQVLPGLSAVDAGAFLDHALEGPDSLLMLLMLRDEGLELRGKRPCRRCGGLILGASRRPGGRGGCRTPPLLGRQDGAQHAGGQERMIPSSLQVLMSMDRSTPRASAAIDAGIARFPARRGRRPTTTTPRVGPSIARGPRARRASGFETARRRRPPAARRSRARAAGSPGDGGRDGAVRGASAPSRRAAGRLVVAQSLQARRGRSVRGGSPADRRSPPGWPVPRPAPARSSPRASRRRRRRRAGSGAVAAGSTAARAAGRPGWRRRRATVRPSPAPRSRGPCARARGMWPGRRLRLHGDPGSGCGRGRGPSAHAVRRGCGTPPGRSSPGRRGSSPAARGRSGPPACRR